MPALPHPTDGIGSPTRPIGQQRRKSCSKPAHEDALSLEKIGRAATEKLHQLYHVEPIDLEPAVYYRLTDNWLDLTMRFVTEIHGTRDVKDKISRTILSRFDTAGIGVASTIYQIVRLPPIELTTGNSQEAPNVN